MFLFTTTTTLHSLQVLSVKSTKELYSLKAVNADLTLLKLQGLKTPYLLRIFHVLQRLRVMQMLHVLQRLHLLPRLHELRRLQILILRINQFSFRLRYNTM